jgi:hypothetical protein
MLKHVVHIVTSGLWKVNKKSLIDVTRWNIRLKVGNKLVGKESGLRLGRKIGVRTALTPVLQRRLAGYVRGATCCTAGCCRHWAASCSHGICERAPVSTDVIDKVDIKVSII